MKVDQFGPDKHCRSYYKPNQLNEYNNIEQVKRLSGKRDILQTCPLINRIS